MKINKTDRWGLFLTISLILICSIMIVVGATSCNTENRAWRLMHKAERIDNTVPPKYCADKFPSVEKYREVLKYRPGIPIKGETKYVTANCDSLINAKNKISEPGYHNKKNDGNTFNIPCPPCDSLRVDTAEILREVTEINRANEKVLQNALNEAEYNLTKTQTELSYWMWGLIIIGSYTFLRWAIAYFSKGRFKLP